MVVEEGHSVRMQAEPRTCRRCMSTNSTMVRADGGEQNHCLPRWEPLPSEALAVQVLDPSRNSLRNCHIS